MPDGGDDVANAPLRPSRVMRGDFSSSSRRRSTVPPRRTSSAPDLRASPSLGSMSTSLDEPSSSASSSVSRNSDSPRRHSDSTQELGTPIALVAPVRPIEQDRLARPATEPLPTHNLPPQQPPTTESATRTLEEVHRLIRELQHRDRRRGARGLWIAVRAFFGYGPEGSVARRDVMSLFGKLLFGAGQIGATIAMLSIAARERSPTNNAINEWQACRQPLGVWSAIWCVRVVLGSFMAVWGYRRKISRPVERAERADEEAAEDVASHVSDDLNNVQTTATGRRESRPHRTGTAASRNVSNVTFARLTTLLSLISLIWFVTAHVLIYTSVHTCRISTPHLWWLAFGIICIGYLVIVEVILVAFIVFILGPLIFVVLNLILICMGRHPLRAPTHINPEVGKLPQKVVDLIPLVLYIPAPAPKESTASGETPQDPSAPNAEESSDASIPSLTIPEAAHAHSYPPVTERPTVSPPTPTSSVPQRSRRLFTFRRIRLRKSVKGEEVEEGKEKQFERGSEGRSRQYEDKWERGEFPFVKLEGNRAACAICLCDFEEPRRVRFSIDSKPADDLDRAEKGIDGGSAKSQQDGPLRLTDAGEGAQPLRLLACAHVFHKSCVDPWLTEVSGRCPVCQRPVEVEDPAKLEDRRRGRSQLHERR